MTALNSKTRRSAVNKALGDLSARQDAAAMRGLQRTYSQVRIGREIGLTRAGIQQLELTAKLRLLKGLAVQCPDVLRQMGATPAQLAFLESVRITSGNSRRLWRRWSQMSL